MPIQTKLPAICNETVIDLQNAICVSQIETHFRRKLQNNLILRTGTANYTP